MRMSRRTGLYVKLQSGQPLSNLAIGSKLAITENGILVPFLVLKHDYESSGRTLVLRNDIYDSRTWGTSAYGNRYEGSSIDLWLTGTYLNLIDAGIRAQIEAVGIPVTRGDGANTLDTINRTAFLLSGTEVGLSASYMRTEGTAISYFDSSTKRIAYYNGTASAWWLRSPRTYNSGRAWAVTYTGVSDGISITSSSGSRPAFTLPASLMVSLEPDASGAYSIV